MSDPSVSATWEHKFGQHGWGNREVQNYTASSANSFIAGGKLVLRATVDSSQPDAAARFTSARVVKRQTIGPRGTLSFRVTAPVAAGIWPAIWLLPREPFSWPTDGEIDLLEVANGSTVNTSCLHWGHYNAEDHIKHQVIKTPVPAITAERGVDYAFAWIDNRAVWYIAGRPVMKGVMPAGTRQLQEFNLIANIAMGGTLCQHVTPQDGSYDLIIHELDIDAALPSSFSSDFAAAPAGTP